MPSQVVALSILFFCINASSGVAWAWGERGHDLIARVAVRLIIERNARDDGFAAVLGQTEHMLGHLANVPDIVWRNQGAQIEAENAPTHYIDSDYFAVHPSYATAPRSLSDAAARLKSLCAAPPPDYVCPQEYGKKPLATLAGSAPFRIAQLHQRMVAALRQAARSKSAKAMIAATDQALVEAGVMAHFVGDLGNPWHTTRDYNGWETGQGGIHRYFEEQLVNALPLTLDSEVMEKARSLKPFQSVLNQVPAGDRARAASDPLSIAWALTFDSFARLQELRALDQNVAVVAASRTEKGMKLAATRRDPRLLCGDFRAIISERLAVAADTLAQLWLLAYEQAGKPGLNGYQSFVYSLAPEFIPAPQG